MLSLSILLPASALTRYDDHGEPYRSNYSRVLIALARFDDWVSSGELRIALDEQSYRGIAWRTALSWLVRRGKVLARGRHGSKQYRINAAAFTRVA